MSTINVAAGVFGTANQNSVQEWDIYFLWVRLCLLWVRHASPLQQSPALVFFLFLFHTITFWSFRVWVTAWLHCSWHYRQSSLRRESRRSLWDMLNLFNTMGVVIMCATVTPLPTLGIAVCVWEFYAHVRVSVRMPLYARFALMTGPTMNNMHACRPCKVNA